MKNIKPMNEAQAKARFVCLDNVMINLHVVGLRFTRATTNREDSNPYESLS